MILALILLAIAGYALGYAGPTGVSGEWQVSAIVVAPEEQDAAADVLKDHPMTVSFVDGELTMLGPCNSQAAKYFRVGDRLISIPGFRTSNLCHWEGYSDGQISNFDRLFHSPSSGLSTISENLVTGEMVWVRGEIQLVMTKVPAE